MLGHFGFSYVGFVFLLFLFIPNIIWTRFTPSAYSSKNENKVLVVFEKLGQVLVTTCAVIFDDYNKSVSGYFGIFLVFSLACMFLYELWWVRYFRSNHTLNDFYRPFLHIPYAGATLPVLAFLSLGIYGKNIWMILSVIILGIGHIGIHFNHFKELQKK